MPYSKKDFMTKKIWRTPIAPIANPEFYNMNPVEHIWIILDWKIKLSRNQFALSFGQNLITRKDCKSNKL